MKVLILGANGFIGLPTSKTFTRAGHTVIGQTRSTEAARELEALEIIPLVVDPADITSWISHVAGVDVVIDAIGGTSIGSLGPTIFAAVSKAAIEARPHGPPLSYIYTSGTWVHGDHPDEQYGATSDRAVLNDPMPITAWRLPHERNILSTAAANPISLTANIIRPSLLYGYSASILGELFASAHAGKVEWAGTGQERIATIHADDLAELFLLVAEKSYTVRGVIFEGSNRYAEPVSHVLTQLVKVSGAKGPFFTQPNDNFHRAIAATNLLRPTLGKTLLGWEPKKAPLAENMLQYYRAWLANQSIQGKL